VRNAAIFVCNYAATTTAASGVERYNYALRTAFRILKETSGRFVSRQPDGTRREPWSDLAEVRTGSDHMVQHGVCYEQIKLSLSRR